MWASRWPTRREQRDMWRKVARARRARGDIEGARRAARNAREADTPLRWQCHAGKMHPWGTRCRCSRLAPLYRPLHDPSQYTALVHKLNDDYERRTREALER